MRTSSVPVLLLLVLCALPCFQLCKLVRERNTTELLCQTVSFTEEQPLVISCEPNVVLTDESDLGIINEHFFNRFPKAKTLKFRNQTVRTTALSKPPKTKHLSLRTLEITNSKWLDNAYTFALHSLVELETFILHSSSLGSKKIDSRLLEANILLKTIDIRNTKFEFEEGALYTLKSLTTLNIVKCDMERIPQVLLGKKSQLKEMNLSGNKLRDVLSKFMFPESLEVLNLIGNEIKTLYRYDFSEMRYLKVLFLDDNLITDLKWDTFDDLKNVENLSLGNNLIKVVTQRHFRSMSRLKALDLSFNCIWNVRQIPWTFDVFWGLQKSDVMEGRVVGNTSCDDV